MGRPPIGKHAMSSIERQRRYWERVLRSKGADAALKAENAALKAEIAALKAELHATLAARFAPKPRAAKPKAERPPLPPDEERDRQIKALRTRVKNLTAELQYVRQWSTRGSMNFNTMSAIAKCLHSHYEPSAEERDTALKLFTAWKADKDKVRRQV